MDADRLLQQTQRFFAVEANNTAWQVIDPPGDPIDALERAWASLYHWRAAGTGLNVARAHGTVSRAYVVAGEPKLALQHAGLYAKEQGTEGWEDWDTYFVHSVRARALTLLGDDQAEAEKAAAKSLADGLESEDRKICLADWNSIP
ncbi:MAG: hypothetical protein AB7F50_00590 [Fimbriimonadaceae bacterium]